MAYSSTKKKSAGIVQISIGILTVILVVLIIAMMMIVSSIQGTARIVNYAGLVRGKTQRIVKPLTDENAVKSRSCGILEGRMRKVTVKMCQRLFFYGKTLVRRKNNGYNPSYNQSRWLYQISYKI